MFATLPPVPKRRSTAHPLRPALLGLALVRVAGRSMQPTLREGDVLLVRLVSPASRQQNLHDRLVVIRLPGRPGVAVKRAVRREPGGWWVERDNAREGVDSWSVGAINDVDVLAVVVTRLWPLKRLSAPPAAPTARR